MKYIKKSDVKFSGVRPQNALHYEDYAVFSSVEEYRQFNLYPTKEEIKAKEDEIYAQGIGEAYLGDGLTRSYYEQQFAISCARQAEKHFEDIRNNARKELAKDATQTKKAFFIFHDMEYRHGDILTICVAAFDNMKAVKEYLSTHDKKDYVVDQDGKRVLGKSLEERKYEQANKCDDLQA